MRIGDLNTDCDGECQIPHSWLFSIGSSNGWVPFGNKPLPKQILLIPMTSPVHCEVSIALYFSKFLASDYNARVTIARNAKAISLNLRQHKAFDI